MIFPKDGEQLSGYDILCNVADMYDAAHVATDHIYRVYMSATNFSPIRESTARVAACHDIVEDSLATYDHLRNWGLTEEEISAVSILNRNEHSPKLPYPRYIDDIADAYVNNVIGANLAIDVKILDLLDHLHPFHVANVKPAKLGFYLMALDQLSRLRAMAGRN